MERRTRRFCKPELDKKRSPDGGTGREQSAIFRSNFESTAPPSQGGRVQFHLFNESRLGGHRGEAASSAKWCWHHLAGWCQCPQIATGPTRPLLSTQQLRGSRVVLFLVRDRHRRGTSLKLGGAKLGFARQRDFSASSRAHPHRAPYAP